MKADSSHHASDQSRVQKSDALMEDDQRSMQAGPVSRLQVQKKNPERISVFIDGRFAFGLHQDLVLEHRLAPGVHLSIERQMELLGADSVRKAYDKALYFIGYRPRTEQEVRRKLQRLEFGETVIEQVIERLYRYAFLDDEAFAQSYIRGRLSSKGYGPRRLRSELFRRGVPESVIDRTLDLLVDEEETAEHALQHAEKRWARLARETDLRKRRKKVFEYLIRRGFDYDQAREALRIVEQDT